ncbi:hypothetical protein M413DRAFT_447629 [Hebeloma cylindrosporum]|uniref:DUF6699 domain-containing protein n=1 Tax=Hebeloma cylindrosporum TaxID=76867 RepID=A0A0C2XLQ9_HEBCY|nr:hypothetical protein M413DRAFT_447629 [Hebeloma cylindrosporum h7]
MSRVYTITARRTTATATIQPEHVVGRNVTTQAPPITYPASSPQIEGQGHHPRQRRAQHPPPLLRNKCIPLPPSADVPIYVNPLLSYNPSKVAIEYDLRLPPITAHFPPTANVPSSRQDWRQQPAMSPSTIGSMTIVVPGLQRVVVVFPSTSDSDVVTVGDVLVTVYRAMQESAFEHHREFGAKRGAKGGRNNGLWGQTAPINGHPTAVEELGDDCWWAGLYPCQNERDVWVLRTRRLDDR